MPKTSHEVNVKSVIPTLTIFPCNKFRRKAERRRSQEVNLSGDTLLREMDIITAIDVVQNTGLLLDILVLLSPRVKKMISQGDRNWRRKAKIEEGVLTVIPSISC